MSTISESYSFAGAGDAVASDALREGIVENVTECLCRKGAFKELGSYVQHLAAQDNRTERRVVLVVPRKLLDAAADVNRVILAMRSPIGSLHCVRAQKPLFSPGESNWCCYSHVTFFSSRTYL